MFLGYPLNFRQLSCSRLNYPVQFYSYQIVVLKLSIFLLTALKLYTKYAFIKRIEDFTGVEAVIVSVGPDRDETLLLKNPFEH